MDQGDRWKAVRSNYLCRICLGKHGRKPCRSWARCDVQGCQMRHHPLLHGDFSVGSKPTPQEGSVVKQGNPTEGVNAHHSNTSTMFRMLPVRLFSNGHSIETLAFIDQGSSVTLLEKRIADTLDIEGKEMRLCLTWTNNISREEEGSLRSQSSGNTHRSKGYSSHCDPTNTGKSRERANSSEDSPWIGNLRIDAEWDQLRQLQHTHLRLRSDENLHELVKQYFTAENVGVSVDSCPESDDDRRAWAVLERTTRRVEGGFKTRLLWRYDKVDSYAMAVRQLRCLEKRFKANPAMFENVQCQIVQYQHKGYIHEATTEELAAVDPRRMWYLPIGVVQNPKKPNKIRIVWDAAATVNGISLNNMLLKGPDLVQLFPDVLSRFRERKITMIGDIMEMFHQLRLRREDRYSQLLLWLGENGNPLKTFVIDVATFAEHAEQYPRAAEAIERRHYVDDYLQSLDSEEETCRVVEEVKLVHQRGGFTIRNWLPNSSAVPVWRKSKEGANSLSPAE
ncbi:uncharacterized protein LOC134206171 [Armigeres subalbatus]|uniref:uncharacterized protein LOC134206171 n=1 Tax=Armigeres subalbatus TaxID=124917 RepID=UPI002ED0B583